MENKSKKYKPTGKKKMKGFIYNAATGKNYNKADMKKIYPNGLKRIYEFKHPGMRVSAHAIEILTKEIEEIATQIIELSVDVCKHSKRKTVKPEDVEWAVGKYKNAKG